MRGSPYDDENLPHWGSFTPYRNHCKQWFVEIHTPSICLEGFHYQGVPWYHEQPLCSSLDALKDLVTLNHLSPVVHPFTKLRIIDLDNVGHRASLNSSINTSWQKSNNRPRHLSKFVWKVLHNKLLRRWYQMKQAERDPDTDVQLCLRLRKKYRQLLQIWRIHTCNTQFFLARTTYCICIWDSHDQVHRNYALMTSYITPWLMSKSSISSSNNLFDSNKLTSHPDHSHRGRHS